MRVVRVDSGDVFFDSYFKLLEETFNNYTGQFSDLVKYIPDMLLLFLNIHKDKSLPKESRQIINAVVTYIVSPFDVVPEGNLGMYAFIDDMFLCCIALKRLDDQIGYEKIKNNWNSDEDLRELIHTIYNKTHLLLGTREEEILEHAGI